MFCFKKIVSYFDYYVNGEKKCSCGYAKLLVKDEAVTIEIQVKDIGADENSARESSMCEIWTEGEKERRLGRFVIDQGTGCYYACHKVKNTDGAGLSIFDVCGLKLVLSEDKYCLTSWEWGKLPEWTMQSEAAMEPEAVRQDEEEKKPEAVRQDEEEKKAEAVRQNEPEKEAGSDGALKKSEIIFSKETEGIQEELYEDKWKQLCSIYPVCHPFGEEEEYIAITLKDFVVLRKEYQNLVSNSFLLHSFYNYHHLILGKMGPNDEIYYIGAPGNYFEREKKVAVMFGFEGFARSSAADGRTERGRGAEDKAETVKNGDFGYYMKKVEI